MLVCKWNFNLNLIELIVTFISKNFVMALFNPIRTAPIVKLKQLEHLQLTTRLFILFFITKIGSATRLSHQIPTTTRRAIMLRIANCTWRSNCIQFHTRIRKKNVSMNYSNMMTVDHLNVRLPFEIVAHRLWHQLTFHY